MAIARKLARPKVIIPAVLAAAIISVFVAFADFKKIIALVVGFPHLDLLWFGLLMVLYELVRGVQWVVLMRALAIKAPLRSQVYAFLLGEFTRNLPLGSYVQNYVLQESRDVDFGRTSAATTLILVSEIAICALGLLVLGLGPWTIWLRPLILGVAAAATVLGWLYARGQHGKGAPAWLREHRGLRKAADAVREFREGAADLLHPGVLAVQGLLGAAYIAIAGVGLYVVLRGLSPHGLSLSLPQTLAVYCVTLISALLLPIPEAGGASALLSLGLNSNLAFTAMLLNRGLSMAWALVLAAVATAALPGELRAALEARRSKGTSPRKEQGQQPAAEEHTPTPA